MKLKEKLADQYAEDMCGIKLKDSPNLNAFIPVYIADAFEAGFEKAREMAAQPFNDEPDVEWEGEFIARIINFTGEEEVK